MSGWREETEKSSKGIRTDGERKLMSTLRGTDEG